MGHILKNKESQDKFLDFLFNFEAKSRREYVTRDYIMYDYKKALEFIKNNQLDKLEEIHRYYIDQIKELYKDNKLIDLTDPFYNTDTGKACSYDENGKIRIKYLHFRSYISKQSITTPREDVKIFRHYLKIEYDEDDNIVKKIFTEDRNVVDGSNYYNIYLTGRKVIDIITITNKEISSKLKENYYLHGNSYYEKDKLLQQMVKYETFEDFYERVYINKDF